MQKKLIILLFCFNVAVFNIAIALLPRAGTYSYTTGNYVEKFINSRYQWDIAWMVLFSCVVLSVGIYIFVEGHYKNDKWQ
ncbi:hypothetical protein [Natronospora cellulosivora (SeqCode)]